MAVGKSSIKRAMESTGSEVKEPAAEAVRAGDEKTGTVKTAATKTGAVKTSRKKSGSKRVAKRVIAGTDQQVMKAVSSDQGINAHYGINTPLPTFLL